MPKQIMTADGFPLKRGPYWEVSILSRNIQELSCINVGERMFRESFHHFQDTRSYNGSYIAKFIYQNKLGAMTRVYSQLLEDQKYLQKQINDWSGEIAQEILS